MAKSPRPGRVKTRLGPPLSPADAASLYTAFLRDTLDRVRGSMDVEVVVAYTPAEDRDVLHARCAPALLLPQPDGDLGARMTSIFETLCARGFRGVVAIGADTPTLPPAFVQSALVLLSRPDVDVVLGPAHDGGYYLVGLKQPQPTLFRDIPWSSDRVYAATMDRAVEAKVHTARLPEWYDIDTGADLDRLVREIEKDGAGCPHTRARLAEFGLL